MQSVYFVSDPDFVSSAVCAVMGAFSHYFILTVFLWMCVIAGDTQRTFLSLSKEFGFRVRVSFSAVKSKQIVTR